MRYLIIIVALIWPGGAFAQGLSLSALPAASSVSGTDLFYDVQTAGVGGVKATAAQIEAFVAGFNNAFSGNNSFTGLNTFTGTQNASTALAAFTNTQSSAPSGVITPVLSIVSSCLGNNLTFEGCSSGFFSANDGSSVAGNKGVLYGLQLAVRPLVARNNSPADDADGLIVSNNSPNGSKATEAVTIGSGSGLSAGAHEWGVQFYAGTDSDAAFLATGNINYGLTMCSAGGCATVANASVQMANNSPLVGRNAANNADIELARVNSSNLPIFDNGAVGVQFGGNVGIKSGGAPGQTLVIGNASINPVIVINSLNSGSGNGAQLAFEIAGAQYFGVGNVSQVIGGAFNSDPIIYINDNNATNGKLHFYFQTITADIATMTASGMQIVNSKTFTGSDSGTWGTGGINGSIIGATTPENVTGTNINATTAYKANGTSGVASQTCTVNQAKTLIFTFGILTGGTCNT